MHFPPPEYSACTAGRDEEAVCSISESEEVHISCMICSACHRFCMFLLS